MLHTEIINLGIALGYFKTNTGACRGITAAWISACLTSDEDKYSRLISRITKDGMAVLVSINIAKEKVKRHETLAAEDNEALQLLAFYEQITIHQFPTDYIDFFSLNFNQEDLEHLSEFTSSEKLQAEGGFSSAYADVGIFSKEELATYLQKMSNAITSVEYEHGEIIGAVLSSHNHAIGLSYDTKSGCWKVMDINQGEPKTFSKDDTLLIAEMLLDGFNAGPKLDPRPIYTAFGMQVLTTANDRKREILISELESLKKENAVTAEIAKRTGVTNLAFLAATHGEHEKLSVLAANSADLNFRYNGVSLAFIAAQHGYARVIAILAEYRVDLNMPNFEGMTPVYMAAQEGNAQALAELIKGGANPNLKYKKSTPALIAAQNGFTQVFAELIKGGADLNAQSIDDMTPTFSAAQQGRAQIIAMLVKQKANLDTPNNEGIAPVFVAAQNGHVKALAELAKGGAKLNVTWRGMTVAYIAAQNGHANVIAALVRRGADLNALNSEGATPALIAAQLGHAQVLVELAKGGANLNTAFKGLSPTYLAAQNGHYDAIIALAEGGADLQAPNSMGITPAAIATANGHLKIAEFILNHARSASEDALKELATRRGFTSPSVPLEMRDGGRVFFKNAGLSLQEFNEGGGCITTRSNNQANIAPLIQ